MMDITPGVWRYPAWEDQEDGQWFLLQQGNIVGEIYPRGDGFRWHCKTSDWRQMAPTVDQAKAECEASFWKDAWEEARRLALADAT